MQRLLTIFLCSAVLSGCSALGLNGTPEGETSMTVPKPEALVASGWLDLQDLSLDLASDPTPPREPHIRGRLLGSLFTPTSGVVGPIGKPTESRRELTPGWLRLASRSFFSDGANVPRTPPYVDGVFDAKTGAFHPTGDVVHAQARSGS